MPGTLGNEIGDSFYCEERITRIQHIYKNWKYIHIYDEMELKESANDKKCLLEARLKKTSTCVSAIIKHHFDQAVTVQW